MKQPTKAHSEHKILITGINLLFPIIKGYIEHKNIGEIRAKVRPVDSEIPPIYVEVKLSPKENMIDVPRLITNRGINLPEAHMVQNIIYGKIVQTAVQQDRAIKTDGVKQIHIREVHIFDEDGKLDNSFMIGKYYSNKVDAEDLFPIMEAPVVCIYGKDKGPPRILEYLIHRFENVKINRTRKVREEIETQEERT